MRFGVETIYRVTRKTGRLRARDLIPPARIEVFGTWKGIPLSVMRPVGGVELYERAAQWWDAYAGPLIRRLQAGMAQRLREHIAKRERAFWETDISQMTLTVDGQRFSAETGERLPN